MEVIQSLTPKQEIINVHIMPSIVWSLWLPALILLIDNYIFVNSSVFNNNTERRLVDSYKTTPRKKCFAISVLPGFISQISELLCGNTEENAQVVSILVIHLSSNFAS